MGGNYKLWSKGTILTLCAMRLAHVCEDDYDDNIQTIGLQCTPLTCDEDYHDENDEQSEQE